MEGNLGKLLNRLQVRPMTFIMEGERLENHRYMFFLQYKSLDEDFFNLASILSRDNWKLLPVKPKDLGHLGKGKKQMVISLVDCLESYNLFRKCRKDFLNLGLFGKKYHLFDITSFPSIKFKSNSLRKEVYHYIPLPEKITVISQEIYKGLNWENDVKQWSPRKWTSICE